MNHVFVSYSHKDTQYAHRLATSLQEIGFDVWIDERLDYGSQWPLEIQRQLDTCDAFILIMSPRSFASDWVQSELQRAKRKLKPIFPLLLEGNEPWLSVESTQYYDVRDNELPDNKFYAALQRVVSVKQSAKIPSGLPSSSKKAESSKTVRTLILLAGLGGVGIIFIVCFLILVPILSKLLNPNQASPAPNQAIATVIDSPPAEISIPTSTIIDTMESTKTFIPTLSPTEMWTLSPTPTTTWTLVPTRVPPTATWTPVPTHFSPTAIPPSVTKTQSILTSIPPIATPMSVISTVAGPTDCISDSNVDAVQILSVDPPVGTPLSVGQTYDINTWVRYQLKTRKSAYLELSIYYFKDGNGLGRANDNQILVNQGCVIDKINLVGTLEDVNQSDMRLVVVLRVDVYTPLTSVEFTDPFPVLR